MTDPSDPARSDSTPPDSTRSNTILAALLLTNRLAKVAAKPYTASEFWTLVESSADLDELLTADVAAIAARTGVDADEATRIRTLLDASRAFAFERERLEDGGIVLVSAFDPAFPSRLVERLGTSCPPFLLVAGPIDSLSIGGLAIVGSRHASDESLVVARDASRAAVEHEWPVITGLATASDEAVNVTAADLGGRSVGVPAEGITVVSRRSDIRRLVHDRQLCIASPYAPSGRLSAATAAGRNKIVHALSNVTFVVSADKGSGDAWSGAVETLQRGWCPIGVWSGTGAGVGNPALVAQGAHPIERVDQLFGPLAITPVETPQTSLF